MVCSINLSSSWTKYFTLTRPDFVKQYLLYMTFICDGCVIKCMQSLVVLAAQSVFVTQVPVPCVRFMHQIVKR